MKPQCVWFQSRVDFKENRLYTTSDTGGESTTISVELGMHMALLFDRLRVNYGQYRSLFPMFDPCLENFGKRCWRKGRVDSILTRRLPCVLGIWLLVKPHRFCPCHVWWLRIVENQRHSKRVLLLLDLEAETRVCN